VTIIGSSRVVRGLEPGPIFYGTPLSEEEIEKISKPQGEKSVWAKNACPTPFEGDSLAMLPSGLTLTVLDGDGSGDCQSNYSLTLKRISHYNLPTMSFTPHIIVRLLSIVPVVLIFVAVANAQQRPLLTEDVDIIPPGTMRIEAGIDFLQGAKFPVSGLMGDLTRVAVIGVNFGIAPNVEFQIEGVAQNFLSINSRGTSAIPLSLGPGATSTNDTGDFTLWTKIKLRNETRRGPSLGFRFGVQLPNSNQSRGLGLNQTNAYGSLLVGKKFGRDGRLNTFGNLGIAILTAPTTLFTQNDVFTYGVAGIFRFNKQFSLAGEVNGRANTRPGNGPPGTESQSEARLGMQIRASGLRFDFAGIKGLTGFSPNSGVTVGVTYDTPRIFTPAK
jgi:hypothetical protein